MSRISGTTVFLVGIRPTALGSPRAVFYALYTSALVNKLVRSSLNAEDRGGFPSAILRPRSRLMVSCRT